MLRFRAFNAEQKEHKEVIRFIARNSSPTTIKCHSSNQISSQHKRKLRSLILCPVNEQLFATRYKRPSLVCYYCIFENRLRNLIYFPFMLPSLSSLDGMVSLWQLQPGRFVFFSLSPPLLKSFSCLSRLYLESTCSINIGLALLT